VCLRRAPNAEEGQTGYSSGRGSTWIKRIPEKLLVAISSQTSMRSKVHNTE
jgi:hypothetical protein